VPVTIHIPGPLRIYCRGFERVEIKSFPATLREAFEALYRECPAVRDRLVTETGELREHINVFVGVENARFTGGFATPLPADAQISILPAVSGG
jgi:molybdopterin converting factor small subunit